MPKAVKWRQLLIIRMKRIFVVLLCVLSVVFETKAQSNSSNNNSQMGLPEKEPEIFLRLSDTIVEFTAAGGDKIITVYTNAPSWSLSGKFFWCTKAWSDSLLELSCKVNLSDIDRNDKFYVLAGNLSKKVEVIQRTMTLLEKGNWKGALNSVMYNVTSGYENGKYKGEIFQKKESDGYRVLKFTYMNGTGIYQYTEKDCYLGEFDMGDNCGKGIFLIGRHGDYQLPNCRDCRYFSGNWSADMKNGQGRCYDKTGKLVYQGNFTNDKPTEKYSQCHDNTCKFEYIEYSNTDKYLGETKNGKRSGLGILIFENGDAWYGEWKDDKRDGKGIILLYNGTIYSGKWKSDVQVKE